MARTVIDIDEDMVAEAMRIYGTRTKARAVRLAMEDAVKRHLRQEGFDAMDAGEFDFSEIVENTGPRNEDGSLKPRPLDEAERQGGAQASSVRRSRRGSAPPGPPPTPAPTP